MIVAVLPLRLVPAVELPLSDPAINVPGSLMVPPVAIRLTVPAPPSVTSPNRLSAVPVRATAVAVTVPLLMTVMAALSLTDTSVPPFSVPVTVSAAPSLSANPDAEKFVIVDT